MRAQNEANFLKKAQERRFELQTLAETNRIKQTESLNAKMTMTAQDQENTL